MSYIVFWFPSDILHTHLHSLLLLVISQVITVICFVLVFFHSSKSLIFLKYVVPLKDYGMPNSIKDIRDSDEYVFSDANTQKWNIIYTRFTLLY